MRSPEHERQDEFGAQALAWRERALRAEKDVERLRGQLDDLQRAMGGESPAVVLRERSEALVEVERLRERVEAIQGAVRTIQLIDRDRRV